MSQTGSSAVWRDSKPWLSELMGRSRCGRRSTRQPSWTRNSAALIMKLWPGEGETSTVAPKYSGFKPQDWLCLTASSEKNKGSADIAAVPSTVAAVYDRRYFVDPRKTGAHRAPLQLVEMFHS